MKQSEQNERIKKIEKFLYDSLDEYNDTIIEPYWTLKIPDYLDWFDVIPDTIDIPEPGDITYGILGPFQKKINAIVVDKLNLAFEKVVKLSESAINSHIANMKLITDATFELLKNIAYGINEGIARFIAMGQGLNDIFTGLFVTEVDGLGEGLKKAFTNIGDLLKWSGHFVFSYITCGVQYIQNLHRCILFYCFDAFGQIIYMPIRLILWFMKTFLFRDIYPLETKIWGYLEEADQYIYYYTGVHISHYPKNIRDSCYNCKRMKTDALKNKAQQINYDFNNRMRRLLEKGVKEMRDGSDKFVNAFTDEFEVPERETFPINVLDAILPPVPLQYVSFPEANRIPMLNVIKNRPNMNPPDDFE